MAEPAAEIWARLREATGARIGLGRRGDAPPVAEVLALQLAHARARDAVHRAMDWAAVEAALSPAPLLRVHSAAPDRATYLRRPDLGRRLAPEAAALLSLAERQVVFVLADGLSAAAVEAQAVPLLQACRARLGALVAEPVVLAEQARVALGDEIGEGLGARMVVMLIGERPGLSVAHSLGAYVTHAPRVGRRDSERNCVSNIHPQGGLGTEAAADRIAWLVREGLLRRLTGVALKEDAANSLGGGDGGLLPGAEDGAVR
ncbi:ethanolamine ammonia-lyase subunit EutC [Roseomonas elaeocarpi]|uniref:Ethanolamine ammonia-lyase small subunit n=1 Tax=Roseomonas elaeocarpi TaxID=907779 RepID=A0ABV6JRK8_9PROT